MVGPGRAPTPLDRISWQPPRSSCPAGPQSAATPAEVQTVLAEVTQIRPELTAFFGCLYYAALRPAEAVALRARSCILPSGGWGQLTLTGSLPRSARAWTGNGTPREPRGLKHRPGGASWYSWPFTAIAARADALSSAVRSEPAVRALGVAGGAAWP
jgi:hypothetical protein